jgi:hypothetical protein
MNYIDKKLKEMKAYLPNKKTRGIELYNSRKKRWTKQIIQNGWADYETWSLDTFLAPYISERLKLFKEKVNGVPKDITFRQWKSIIDKMIKTFEFISSDNYFNRTTKEQKRVEEGLFLFSKYYQHLWW